MAGHSKWANIKHRKGAKDKKRGKLFTRCIKDIYVAVKEGGDDVSSNPKLKTSIQNAKGVNMPKDTIERAIKKASSKDSDSYVETTYEGYGPGGVAFFIECTTDNINRTVANIRAIFNKFNGELGKNGSLEFLFNRIGVFELDKNIGNFSEEELEMSLIDGGLEEFETMSDAYFLSTNFENFGLMQKKLEELKIVPKNARLERLALETKKISKDHANTILNMIEKFEEDDDVQDVFHSLEIIED